MRVAYFDTNVIRDVFERNLISPDIFLVPDIVLISVDHLFELSAGLHTAGKVALDSRLQLIDDFLSLPNARGVDRMDKLLKNEADALSAKVLPNQLSYVDLVSELPNIKSRIQRRSAGTLFPNELGVLLKRYADKANSHQPWVKFMREMNLGLRKPRDLDDLIERKLIDPKKLLEVVHGRIFSISELNFFNQNREKFPYSIVALMVNIDLIMRALDGPDIFKHDRLDDARHAILAGESDFVSSDDKLLHSLRQLGRANLFTPKEYLSKLGL